MTQLHWLNTVILVQKRQVFKLELNSMPVFRIRKLITEKPLCKFYSNFDIIDLTVFVSSLELRCWHVHQDCESGGCTAHCCRPFKISKYPKVLDEIQWVRKLGLVSFEENNQMRHSKTKSCQFFSVLTFLPSTINLNKTDCIMEKP